MNPNYYLKQKERAIKRKLELIKYKGGKCEVCGYDKNISAFEFHHLDPSQKLFQLDSRHLSNTTISKIKEEVDKCILVCANCHRELHNPELETNKIEDYISKCTVKSIKTFGEKHRTTICEKCGKSFQYVKGKKYCSKECREADKNYPSIDEINTLYQELKSWDKVAKHFNITRKIVKGIRQRNNKKDNVRNCLLLLEEKGWSELIDSRWKKDVIKEIKNKFPNIPDEDLNEVLNLVLV